MTSEQRKATLDKEYSIVQATLDYLIGLHGRTIVYDGEDMIGHYYKQEKQKAEEYYQKRKRSRLQMQLKKLTKSLEHSLDFNYPIYIQKQTGYTPDLFDQLKKDINHIISQGEILTQTQWTEAGRMLEFCKRTHTDTIIIEKLNQLIQDFTQKNLSELTRKKRNQRTEIVSRSVLDEDTELVTVRMSTGPKPKLDKEWEILSPDKKRKIRICQLAYGKHAHTYVNVLFPKTQGTAYYTKGIHDIEAYWKDNTTIVICTTPDHEPMLTHKKVESFEHTIHIEYQAS